MEPSFAFPFATLIAAATLLNLTFTVLASNAVAATPDALRYATARRIMAVTSISLVAAIGVVLLIAGYTGQGAGVLVIAIIGATSEKHLSRRFYDHFDRARNIAGRHA